MNTLRIYDHFVRVHNSVGDLRKCNSSFGSLTTHRCALFVRNGADRAISNWTTPHTPIRRVENVVVSMMFLAYFHPAHLEEEAENACIDGLRICAAINDGEMYNLATRFVCGSSGRVIDVPGATSMSATPIERLNIYATASNDVVEHLNGLVCKNGMTGDLVPGKADMNRVIRVTIDATTP